MRGNLFRATDNSYRCTDWKSKDKKSCFIHRDNQWFHCVSIEKTDSSFSVGVRCDENGKEDIQNSGSH